MMYDLELKYNMVLNLVRIADTLEKIAQPKENVEEETRQKIRSLEFECTALKTSFKTLLSLAKGDGQEIIETMDDERLDLLEKHRRIREIGNSLIGINPKS